MISGFSALAAGLYIHCHINPMSTSLVGEIKLLVFE